MARIFEVPTLFGLSGLPVNEAMEPGDNACSGGGGSNNACTWGSDSGNGCNMGEGWSNGCAGGGRSLEQ